MKSLRGVLSGIFTTAALALVKVPTAMAQSAINSGAQAAQGNGQPSELFADGAVFNNLVNTMLFIIGAVAVVMVIYGGFRYVISGGDSSSVTSAKNTILYAIVGIIVALLAYAAVNFVITTIGAGSGSTGL